MRPRLVSRWEATAAKTAAFFFSLFFALAATQGASQCPSACKCNETAVACLCKSPVENVTISRQLLQANDIEDLTIDNCSLAHFPFPENMTTLDRLRLRRIRVSNVGELAIEHFSLAYMGHVNSIVIEDVHRWRMSHSIFYRAKHVEKLDVRNVRIDILPDEAFHHEFPVDQFNVVHAVIGRIESFGIYLKKGSVFRIHSSIIGQIEYSGISVNDYDHFVLESTSVKLLESESVLAKNVANLHVKKCVFEEVDTEAIKTDGSLDTLHVEGNHANTLRRSAFSGFAGTKSVYFVGNRVSDAEEDSLVPNKKLAPYETSYMEVSDNLLACECALRWLWHDRGLYGRLIDTSRCTDPERLEGKYLRELADTVKEKDEFGCYPDGAAAPYATLSALWPGLVVVLRFLTFAL